MLCVNNIYLVFSVLSILGFLGGGLFLFFERKLIALGQKRLGISFIGRHGWLHLPADVLKFWLKSSIRFVNISSMSLLSFLCLYLIWSLISTIFYISNNYTSIYYLDFMFFLFLGYVSVSNFFFIYLVITLKSKYSTLAALRSVVLILFFEVPFNIFILFIYTYFGDYVFKMFYMTSSVLWVWCLPIFFIFLFFSLFESKRAPFDHTEAESELVAGHLIEYGGRLLLVFFICEYIHGFFNIFIVLVSVLGPSSYFLFFDLLLLI